MRVTRDERNAMLEARRAGVPRAPSAGLNGITDLRGSLDGQTIVVCCSGTSLRDYDDSIAPRSWPRFAVNEAIRALGEDATYWVLADSPIIHEYAEFCLRGTAVLAMHEAGNEMRRMKQLAGRKLHTVDSIAQPVDCADGYRFYSRGTVLIGALEMARYMGAKRAFVFGLDCYRTPAAYYYDNRKPLVNSERLCLIHQRVQDLPIAAYVTDRIRRMIEKLDQYVASGLAAGLEVHCVGSPYSQQRAFPKMAREEFVALVEREARSARRQKADVGHHAVMELPPCQEP